MAEAGVPGKYSAKISRAVWQPPIIGLRAYGCYQLWAEGVSYDIQTNTLQLQIWLEWRKSSMQSRWGWPPSRAVTNSQQPPGRRWARRPEPGLSCDFQEHWGQWRVHTLFFSPLPGAEAGEEVVRLSSGGPQQYVLLMKSHLYARILSTHLKFRTNKCNLGC